MLIPAGNNDVGKEDGQRSWVLTIMSRASSSFSGSSGVLSGSGQRSEQRPPSNRRALPFRLLKSLRRPGSKSVIGNGTLHSSKPSTRPSSSPIIPKFLPRYPSYCLRGPGAGVEFVKPDTLLLVWKANTGKGGRWRQDGSKSLRKFNGLWEDMQAVKLVREEKGTPFLFMHITGVPVGSNRLGRSYMWYVRRVQERGDNSDKRHDKGAYGEWVERDDIAHCYPKPHVPSKLQTRPSSEVHAPCGDFYFQSRTRMIEAALQQQRDFDEIWKARSGS